jgi:acetyl esterase/lipase
MSNTAFGLASQSQEAQIGVPAACDPAAAYRALRPGGGVALSSYLRWIPRVGSRLRVELACWFLRRVVRLEVRHADAVLPLRKQLLRLDRHLFRAPAWCRHESVQMQGVPAEWIQAEGHAGDRVVLYLHGGGFAFHFPNGYRAFAARLSRALRARVLLPEYRLSPEHRFPAPQDDVLSTYRVLLARGVPASRIVIAGDSAGGNLTLGLLQRLLQEGLPQPACAVALSPVTDLALESDCMHALAEADPVLAAASLPILRDQAFSPAQWSDPVASPVHGAFARTAPTLVMCGTREVLLDDACLYAQRVREGGGSVVCEVWEDMPHVFPLLSQLKEATTAIEHIARFVDLTLDAAPAAA